MEEWRDIEGYEGLYQVSNLGRVKSVDRIHTYEAFGKIINRSIKGKVLKGNKSGTKRDYWFVGLCKENVVNQQYIHRLVAKAFPEICGEQFEGAEINHKDENKRQ